MAELSTPLPTKEQLLDLLVTDPLSFTDEHLELLLSREYNLDFAELRSCVFRIFDINEKIFAEESDAAIPANVKSQRKRVRRFYDRFRNGFNRAGKKVIVAEGDSWFEFPQAIDDIIDHLNTNNRYNIYSLAYGGDWITNIIYDGKYVEKLSTFSPDVFMVSGGGNDLVGADRLGLMVRASGGCRVKHQHLHSYNSLLNDLFDGAVPPLTENTFARMVLVQGFITSSFYSFILVLKAQYLKMFAGIHHKHPHIRIITQAYDYAIPSPRIHPNPFTLRHWVNKSLKTGKWLYIPLMISGVTDPALQQDIIRYMIDELNIMFAQIAKTHPNVYHIDCRGVARSADDWYDELHLKNHGFAQVARAYQACIDFEPRPGDKAPKIFYARNYSELKGLKI